MAKKWRPEDWFNRHLSKVFGGGFRRQNDELADAYEEGANAMLDAIIHHIENKMEDGEYLYDILRRIKEIE